MSTASASSQLLEMLFSGTLSLSEERFSSSAWLIMEQSKSFAETLGHKRIGLTSLLLGMIDQPSNEAESNSLEYLIEKLMDLFGAGDRSEHPLELSRDFLTEDVQRVLQSAYEFAENDQSQIEPQHLWAGVLAEAPHFLKQVFEKLPFQVEFEQGEDEADSGAEETALVDDWTERLSPVMRQALGAEDLTFVSVGLPAMIERSFAEGDVYEKIARSLFRSEAKHGC